MEVGSAARGGGGTEPGLRKRLMAVLRAVYHMLRRGLCGRRLMMDLQLLLGRGKLAGKALRDLLVAAHHSHSHSHHSMVVPSSSRAGRAPSSSAASALPAAAAAPGGGLAFGPYDPRDVEFSCTTTPSYSFGFGGAGHPARALFNFRLRGRGRARGSGGAQGCDGLDFAQVARALERMHASDEAAGGASGSGSGSDHLAALSSPSPSAAGDTPSPMLALSLGRSPAGARRLRVTDSPFPVDDSPEGLDARAADSTFDAFISKFYETLRLQQADATPDNRARRRG